MRITNSGYMYGSDRRISIRFAGENQEIIRLIDYLSIAGEDHPLIMELAQQVNVAAGTPVDLPAPKGSI